MQQAYEDRISALRAQVDRITSRQMLDQQLMETKVGELIERQTQLTQRHGRLGPILDRVEPTAGALPATAPVPTAKPDIRAGLTVGGRRASLRRWPASAPAATSPSPSGRRAQRSRPARRRPTRPTSCSSPSTSRCARSRPSSSPASTRSPRTPTRPPTRFRTRWKTPACRSTRSRQERRWAVRWSRSTIRRCSRPRCASSTRRSTCSTA